MRILYLYSEVMGYNISIFETLVHRYNATVDVVHWDQKKLTPFTPDITDQVRFHRRSEYTTKTLIALCRQINPDLVYISGWMDSGYLKAVADLKKHRIPIVAGFDTQWTGSVRQRLGALLMRLHYRAHYFDYASVPGPMQYAYACRLGFKPKQILYPLLSANTSLFCRAAESLDNEKIKHYPQRFLYVGRFVSSKGIDLLLDAYRIYKAQYAGRWGLTCIGNGPLLESLHQAQEACPEIEVMNFSSQADLVGYAEDAGAFILPSRLDPWGVVAHEFTAAGLPIIMSDSVGARAQFLIDGFNGYGFNVNSAQDLASKMNAIASLSTSDLVKMGKASAKLASSITTEIAAASFVSAARRPNL